MEGEGSMTRRRAPIRACLALLALCGSALVGGGAEAQYRGYGYSYDSAPDYYYGGPFDPGAYGPPPGARDDPDYRPYGPPADPGYRRGDADPYADPRDDDGRRYQPRRDDRGAMPYADPLRRGGPDAYNPDYGPDPAPDNAAPDPAGPGGPDADQPAHKASDIDLGESAHRTTRAEVENTTKQPPGTIVIDTGARKLFYTEDNGRALAYGIGVGRQGFSWKGVAQVKRKSEWPDWYPPSDMLKRRPDLPTHMAGGIENPLGARALYLFQGNKDTMFRIHGTNEPDTIGKAVSSGCIRMLNADVIDLYNRVPVGTKVVVL
jgi:lipoprotein-anchoring transpeptidase ErfK/SrfK